MRLLALDTASELCSAALWLDGQLLWREAIAPRAHAALILPMIDELLAEAGVSLAGLDAIAFGRGPGAFTGVRLAVSIAQGLGFAAQRPLIGISDLRATAAQALEHVADAADAAGAPDVPSALGAVGALICQDARMEEVYWACFERRALPAGAFAVEAVGPEGVAPASQVRLPSQWAPERGAPAGAATLVAGGSGFAAYQELSVRLRSYFAAILPKLQPRAREVAQLAAQDGMQAAVAAQDALPVYLRDRVTATPAPGLGSQN